jgi:glycosyltransferase involved in cell wall biosynthesis
LKDIGVEVVIADSAMPDVSGYDLVHFFNLRNPQDLLINVRRVKKLNIPSVLSTIWGSYFECDIKSRKGLVRKIFEALGESRLEYFKVLARALLNANINFSMLPYLWNGHLKSQEEIFESVDVILPNSLTELERVKSDMSSVNKLGTWVPNAIDRHVFDYESVNVSEKFEEYRGCLVSVARIEIRKSQLDLIKAIEGTGYKLVLVGRPSPNNKKYYHDCVAAAGDNVYFITNLDHYELAQLYKVSKAHALISWMETPGLSSLEAAAMKSNILVTNRGDTEFYFENLATYCEPGDIESIRRGIKKVMCDEFNESLRERILDKFSWEETARKTFEGYHLAISKKTL